MAPSHPAGPSCEHAQGGAHTLVAIKSSTDRAQHASLREMARSYWEEKRQRKERLMKVDGHDVLRENNYDMQEDNSTRRKVCGDFVWWGDLDVALVIVILKRGGSSVLDSQHSRGNRTICSMYGRVVCKLQASGYRSGEAEPQVVTH
eukprot:1156479-Pelagomonas_calceolata.AAC.5